VASWPRCPRCHHPKGTGRGESDDCLECRDWPSALARARYAFVLAHPADHLVHALKYEGWSELAGFMGSCIAGAVSHDLPALSAGGAPVIVVPVPTTVARARARGYNQAALLAVEVGRRIGVSVCPALTRRPGAASQTSLSPAERRYNVRSVFEPVPGAIEALAGASILLVDDVLTTGATATEAAGVLVAAGAERVTLATFTRALPRITARAGSKRAA
jgi:ComF family protein